MPAVVSIILPTFNRLKYLPAAVESVMAQTLHSWELIIADDGSAAETCAYLESLDDSRIRVLWLAHTGIPAKVRNAALREAQGRYVAFLDSDDLWRPDKLRRQVQSLGQHPQRHWSYTRFELVDAFGEPSMRAHPGGWPVPCGWIRDNVLKGDTVIALPSVLVSRELMGKVGGFSEELVMCEDYELWLRLAAASEIDALDEPLTIVRRHAEHSGSSVIALQDSARVLASVMRADGTRHLRPILRRQRAEIASDLASSHAACGSRLRAMGLLLASVPRCWRYPYWWRGALQTCARILTPKILRKIVHNHRGARRPPSEARP